MLGQPVSCRPRHPWCAVWPAVTFTRAEGASLPASFVVHDLQAVEPLLRKVVAHEIRTTMPLDDVVAEILHLAGALA